MSARFANIRGDWLEAGSFLSGRGILKIAVVDDLAYALDRDGRPETRDPPLAIHSDGALAHGKCAEPIFLPDNGEVARVEVAHGQIFRR